MKQGITILCLAVLFNCVEKKEKSLTANDIIGKSIEVSGGKKFDKSVIAFDFRDKHYKATRNEGTFELVRTFKDSINDIADYLSNTGFERYINNDVANVPDSMKTRYSSSVNAVHYFSVLPYGLSAEAVKKELLGETTIKDVNYYEIKVTFNQDGGGEDFEDVFVYWVNKETFKVDYLAYSYAESDGVGLRFREAYNEKYVNNLRFVDYNNYKSVQQEVEVADLDSLFQNGKLKLLSKIELNNITVD